MKCDACGKDDMFMVCRECAAESHETEAKLLAERAKREQAERELHDTQLEVRLQKEQYHAERARSAALQAENERLLHGLYHARDIECSEDHDESGAPCPRRIAKEAIDNRPCSICAALSQPAPTEKEP